MDESKLVYEFYHKDQFGQEFKFEAKIDGDWDNDIVSHLEQFKCFLLSMTYHPDLVNRIIYKEEE